VTKLGFKEITQTNWLQADEVSARFVQISAEGTVTSMIGDDWLQAILKPQIIDTVPKEVQALFEVARGALVYGYFYYPLYTLAAEQLFRVIEAAVHHKCDQLSAPQLKNLDSQIKWLVKQDVIPKTEADRWDAARRLRNSVSHPTDQNIFTPGMALTFLYQTSDDINSLFIVSV
jgi:hypothetical protein